MRPGHSHGVLAESLQEFLDHSPTRLVEENTDWSDHPPARSVIENTGVTAICPCSRQVSCLVLCPHLPRYRD